MTRGEIVFNPARVLETYLSMRNQDADSLPRFLMRPRQSVKYEKFGVNPDPKNKENGRSFNLHNPLNKCCFMANEVLGKERISSMIPDFCDVLKLNRYTNKDVRTTAVQTLRMASFSTEEVAKVSRHKRPSTIDRHYDSGLRTETRANMAVALGQASSLRRGAVFQPVSDHLQRKECNSRVELASPAEMVQGGGGLSSGNGASSTEEPASDIVLGTIVVPAEASHAAMEAFDVQVSYVEGTVDMEETYRVLAAEMDARNAQLEQEEKAAAGSEQGEVRGGEDKVGCLTSFSNLTFFLQVIVDFIVNNDDGWMGDDIETEEWKGALAAEKERRNALLELPAEYLASSLAKQPQEPQPKPKLGKSEAELKEEEELQLALRLSMSGAAEKEAAKR